MGFKFGIQFVFILTDEEGSSSEDNTDGEEAEVGRSFTNFVFFMLIIIPR
jgi:hypothetical protein